MKQGCLLSTIFQYSAWIKQAKEIKRVQIGKDEVKLSLFVDVMIL
jgi:hypothetical protein